MVSFTSKVQGMPFSVTLEGKVSLEDACTENPKDAWLIPLAWRFCHWLLTVPDIHLHCSINVRLCEIDRR